MKKAYAKMCKFAVCLSVANAILFAVVPREVEATHSSVSSCRHISFYSYEQADVAEQECDRVLRVVSEHFPAREVSILLDVAREYELDDHQTKLLFAIRKVENGRPGLELGVGDGIMDHPARRYAYDFEKSLRLQARWAAGTITKRYNGDLYAFATRYCPVNRGVWHRNAKFWMERLKG